MSLRGDPDQSWAFIGAPDPPHEIVFTKNATESLNLLGHSWGRQNLRSGDVVVLSELEHHANIVPWLMLAEERRVELRYVPVDGQGRLDLSDLDRILDGASLVSVSAMSNVLGTVPPIADIAEAAHRGRSPGRRRRCAVSPPLRGGRRGPRDRLPGVLRHKMLGPTGIGVLWARAELLDAMPPFLGGGGMILDVRTDRFLPATPPNGSRPAPHPSPKR